MPTLEAIETKIRRLQEQAEAIKAKKASATLDRIVALMKESGISVADVEVHLGSKKRVAKAGKTAASGATVVAAKYMDPKSGATWSGRGRAPAWIANAKNRDRFLVDGIAATATASTSTGSKAKRRYATTIRAGRSRLSMIAAMEPNRDRRNGATSGSA
ncbi:MAG TPA: H-NS histone family protein [Trinickia sp.]|uniref:H-NS histone family protein n=1 Tax=Trinickia sp. TaxID=2571163 RepID=UPI002D0D7A57|nr:H-NS histone family protein [Trinickia sp.]HVW53886.1 H-NS histone family protein [Trinickia sp.]